MSARSSSSPTRPRSTRTIPRYWKPLHICFSGQAVHQAISGLSALLDEYPNSHYAYTQIGMCLLYTGRADEAVPMFETAIRRDPRSGWSYERYERLGLALLMLRKDEGAILWTQRALATIPNGYTEMRAQLTSASAAAYARLGHFDAAHRALAEANRIWPYDTVQNTGLKTHQAACIVEQIEQFQAALRLAGHRDHSEEYADFGCRRMATCMSFMPD